jgi:putative transposase
MKGKRYSTEQKIRILREAERTDKTILYVCREQQISEQTFHRWKKEFGMMEVDQAKQLKELQKENARLKRMLADEMLGKELLKEGSQKGSCRKSKTRKLGVVFAVFLLVSLVDAAIRAYPSCNSHREFFGEPFIGY